jgi:hypothetical protein
MGDFTLNPNGSVLMTESERLSEIRKWVKGCLITFAKPHGYLTMTEYHMIREVGEIVWENYPNFLPYVSYFKSEETYIVPASQIEGFLTVVNSLPD